MLDKDVYEKMKYLQEETGTGMLWCRAALKKFDNDYIKALEYLQSEQFESIKNHGIN